MASSSPARHPIARPRRDRRERRREEIRERLFRAALRLFAERGFMETTVEDITEAADVGKGTFFNYFRTKEHVLATFGAERLATLERAAERAKQQPVKQVLEQLAVDLISDRTENAALLRAIYAAHASCAPVRAELHKRLHIARRFLAEIFSIAQERGEIRRDISAAQMARVVQIVLVGITLAWALDPDSSLRGRVQQAWDLFLPSLFAEGRHKGPSPRRGRQA